MLFYNIKGKITGLIICILFLLLFNFLSIVLGYTDISIQLAIDAFRNFNGTNEHIIIHDVRLPRALIATTVGASLGIAGALLQALTRNPLASPDILGFNAGASFAIVVALMLFSVTSLQVTTWIAFFGAAIAGVIVYFLGSIGRDGMTPIKMTLAGAAIAALFGSLTQGLLVMDESALDQVLFWMSGSVQGRKLELLLSVLPYLVIGIFIALFISNQINVLTMGEDVAKGLGQRTAFVKLVTGISIILLAGGSVAIAGPIGFIGIIVPHFVKSFVGNDYRWIIPYCGIVGGIFLLIADIGARYILMPQEVPVGIMTAIVGAPFFIYIARKGRKVA
ncbi:iron complex transport system permease protein [Ureibacillus xyleni]|uniref:Iron complex transport system permease protein n=1 Tax=Ureibacillus xyleni TaxID=614648 RepID=A0A285T632_9BACL|nr:iron ABC transporter permease [Ureibacillus xyleni]SOC16660.1 iron complex transport system permease protein [Ureibacillus xyleni]